MYSGCGLTSAWFAIVPRLKSCSSVGVVESQSVITGLAEPFIAMNLALWFDWTPLSKLPGSTGAGLQQQLFSTLQHSISSTTSSGCSAVAANVFDSSAWFVTMLQVVDIAAVGRASARKGAIAVSTKARQRRKKFFCRSDFFTWFSISTNWLYP